MHCYLKTNNNIIFNIYFANVFFIQNLQDTFEENISQSFDSQKTPEVFREILNYYFRDLQRAFVAGRVSQADLGIV
jgi:cell shape-determining protein MreC